MAHRRQRSTAQGSSAVYGVKGDRLFSPRPPQTPQLSASFPKQAASERLAPGGRTRGGSLGLMQGLVWPSGKGRPTSVRGLCSSYLLLFHYSFPTVWCGGLTLAFSSTSLLRLMAQTSRMSEANREGPIWLVRVFCRLREGRQDQRAGAEDSGKATCGPE